MIKLTKDDWTGIKIILKSDEVIYIDLVNQDEIENDFLEENDTIIIGNRFYCYDFKKADIRQYSFYVVGDNKYD